MRRGERQHALYAAQAQLPNEVYRYSLFDDATEVCAVAGMRKNRRCSDVRKVACLLVLVHAAVTARTTEFVRIDSYS